MPRPLPWSASSLTLRSWGRSLRRASPRRHAVPHRAQRARVSQAIQAVPRDVGALQERDQQRDHGAAYDDDDYADHLSISFRMSSGVTRSTRRNARALRHAVIWSSITASTPSENATA